MRHVDYIAERIGVDSVAFGSDFEGATVPAELGGMDGLPRLVEALRARGYDDEALAKITHGNWLRVLGQTWRRWGRYFDMAGDDARPTLLDALDRFDEPGLAVDLGAGTGRDTAELLRRGWSVIAIDGEREAIDRLLALVGGESPRLETRVGRFEDEPWPQCDLVNASYALPFTRAEQFDALWARIVASLRPGGRFSGQIFGVNDEWAGSGVHRQDPRRGRARCSRRSRSSTCASSTPATRRQWARRSTGTCSTSSLASGDRLLSMIRGWFPRRLSSRPKRGSCLRAPAGS